MGQAEIISLSEVRASKQWASLRQQLHDRFDQWLDRLEAQLPEPETCGSRKPESVDILDTYPGHPHSLVTDCSVSDHFSQSNLRSYHPSSFSTDVWSLFLHGNMVEHTLLCCRCTQQGDKF